MLVGIVIGSGIFFRADNVLSYTNGNVLLGVVAFFVAATAIVFGSLAISQLAMRTDDDGGVISYAQNFCSGGLAGAFGWFQTFLYIPALCAVAAHICGIYSCMLFGISGTLENQLLIGGGLLVLLFLMNGLSARLGGYFQNASMVIKLIPLAIIAVVGLVFGNPQEMLQSDVKGFGNAVGTGLWISAFAPIAYSFDGWIVATTISHEIKNSKKNLPLAMIISPIMVLLVYVAYFVGIASLNGANEVMEHGDASVYITALNLFGSVGSKLVLIFVIISVLGTMNGLVLGHIRMPFALATRKMIPQSNSIKKVNKKFDMPTRSAAVAFVFTMLWLLLHYFTKRFGLMGESDVSEIAIGVSYLNYIFLYIAVMRLCYKGEIKNKLVGYAIPILACLGSIIILSGSVANPMFIYFVAICIGIMFCGYMYFKRIGRE